MKWQLRRIESLTQMESCITKLECLTKIGWYIYFDSYKKTALAAPHIRNFLCRLKEVNVPYEHLTEPSR